MYSGLDLSLLPTHDLLALFTNGAHATDSRLASHAILSTAVSAHAKITPCKCSTRQAQSRQGRAEGGRKRAVADVGTWQKRSAAITAATGATQLRTSAKGIEYSRCGVGAVSIRIIDIVDRRRVGRNAGCLRVQSQ